MSEPRRGYGYACAAGVAALGDGEGIVFLDADFSFLPAEMPRLLAPLQEGRADLVLGSRQLGHIVPGSMPPAQRFGNWLGASLIRLLYGLPVTDLGPYRAIRRDLLSGLNMRERTFGWAIEMIIKAARGACPGARSARQLLFTPRRLFQGQRHGAWDDSGRLPYPDRYIPLRGKIRALF